MKLTNRNHDNSSDEIETGENYDNSSDDIETGENYGNSSDEIERKVRSEASSDDVKREFSVDSSDYIKREVNEDSSDEIKREVSVDSSDDVKTEVSVDSSDETKREVSWESSEHLKAIAEGVDVCGDSHNAFSKPDWFNAVKFRQGQQFAMKHLYGIMFADLMSLLVLFALPGGLEPLIFTGQSETPFKAFKRYLSTALRVNSWYETDVWDVNSEGHKNLVTVRRMHETVRRRMMTLPGEEVKARGTLEKGGGTSKMGTDHDEGMKKDLDTGRSGMMKLTREEAKVRGTLEKEGGTSKMGNNHDEGMKKDLETVWYRMTKLTHEEVKARGTLENGKGNMWASHHEEIQKDFATVCPMRVGYIRGPIRTYLSQSEMAVTQFGFMGLVLLFPTSFGIHSASKSDLEGFVHFWRTIGYLLGIEDRFNLCTGSCDAVKQKCRDVLELWALPQFKSLTRDWIHMSRCAMEGTSYVNPLVSFDVVLLYLCSVLDIDLPSFRATLTIWQRCNYYFTMFVLGYVVRLPGIPAFINWLIRLSLKQAGSKSSEELRKLQQLQYGH